MDNTNVEGSSDKGEACMPLYMIPVKETIPTDTDLQLTMESQVQLLYTEKTFNVWWMVLENGLILGIDLFIIINFRNSRCKQHMD